MSDVMRRDPRRRPGIEPTEEGVLAHVVDLEDARPLGTGQVIEFFLGLAVDTQPSIVSGGPQFPKNSTRQDRLIAPPDRGVRGENKNAEMIQRGPSGHEHDRNPEGYRQMQSSGTEMVLEPEGARN